MTRWVLHARLVGGEPGALQKAELGGAPYGRRARRAGKRVRRGRERSGGARRRLSGRPAHAARRRGRRAGRNTGGGRLVLEDGRALVLRRDVAEPVAEQRFAGQVDALAAASLVWAHDLFARAVETVNRS